MNISSKTKEEGVWWFIVHEHHNNNRGEVQKVPVYTKASLWFDAREILGGHPSQVLDARVCARIEKALKKDAGE